METTMNLQSISISHAPDLTAQLGSIVRSANRPDIKSVYALISKMTGSQAATVMTLRLLYWFPRARKADGWVYKSWRDWKAECDLSQSQVKRINPEQFLVRIAEFLDMPAKQVHAWIRPEPNSDSARIDEADSDQTIGRKQPVQDSRNDQSQVAETAKTITGIYQQDQHSLQRQTTQQQAVVVDPADGEADRSKLQHELETIGICRSKAGILASQYALERLREVLDHASDSSVSNPAGFAVRALEESWRFTDFGRSRQDSGTADPMAYVSGKYAAYVNY